MTLPDGSLYVAATDYARSWSDERHMCADVLDAIVFLTWAMTYDHEQVPDPPRTTRPADVVARRRQRERQRRAREILENSTWVEV